jgi:Spy/CpxP family protein refolding chaperone
MKKTNLFFALMLMITCSIFAQPGNAPENKGNKPYNKEFNKESMEAMKIAFITKHLEITEQQATTFWPIYNQYEAEKKALKKSTFGDFKKDSTKMSDISNEDADKIINNYLAFKTKELELSKKYVTEFKKVLSSKQVAKLITSENHFKNMMSNQVQKMNKPTPPNKQYTPNTPK